MDCSLYSGPVDVVIELVAGHSLPAADADGGCDPYIEMVAKHIDEFGQDPEFVIHREKSTKKHKTTGAWRA